MTDLDLDIQFYLWENVELNELISIAETNRQLSVLAKDIFQFRYAKKTFIIADDMDCGGESFLVENKVILICDSELILRMLSNFGHLIMKLSLKPTTVEQTKIIQSINRHCTDTLSEIHIHSFQSNFFDQITKPFAKLQSVYLQGFFRRLISSTLSFGELMPALRNFSFEFVFIGTPNCTSDIAQELPNLEHLSVNVNQFFHPGHVNEDDFTELMRKNPQIQRITLQFGDRYILKIINEILPNLYHLELEDYVRLADTDQGEQRIVFEHVQNFTITDSSVSVPENTDFRNLIEFHSDGSQAMGIVTCYKWFDVVENGTQLEKLFVKRHPLNDEQLEKLASMSSKLKEIVLNVEVNIKDEAIVKLVKNSQKLERMQLSVGIDYQRSFKSVAKMIKREFGKKFLIKSTECELIIEYAT